MKGRLLLIVLIIVGSIFAHFFNSNLILRLTQKMSQMEKTYQAERNINVELMIEHDDLISGRQISTLIPLEMSKYISKEKAKNIIYIQETIEEKTPVLYCIIDLLTPKAEAATAEQSED